VIILTSKFKPPFTYIHDTAHAFCHLDQIIVTYLLLCQCALHRLSDEVFELMLVAKLDGDSM